MEMSDNLSPDIQSQAEGLIAEIEAALEAKDNTKAAGRGEKLNKLLTS
jgi:hypothetical protein